RKTKFIQLNRGISFLKCSSRSKDNIIFARLMDAGKLLKAKISRIEQKGSFKQICVGIYLVDL
ncbi:MAG: hypothetical protein K6E90_00050, partial [Lachnospiraceae bacterium]|nr:hypothetical protein [Lachnospiraceae bacterium]